MIDCHYHLDEAMVSVSGLVASMDEAGVERSVLMAALCPPIEPSPFAKYAPPIMRKLMNNRIKLVRNRARMFYKSIVRSDRTIDLGGRKYQIFPQPDNSNILKAMEGHPDRFLGWIFVNPSGSHDPIQEIEKYISNKGFIGVKAHPYWHDYRVSNLADTAAYCVEKGMPMLVHLGIGPKGDYKFLPEEFPSLKIIYAHAGVPYVASVCTFAHEMKNVYVDLSSSAYVDATIGKEAIRLAGADKCLFGTDGPYLHCQDDRFDFSASIDKLKGLELNDAYMELVAGKNFLSIIGQ